MLYQPFFLPSKFLLQMMFIYCYQTYRVASSGRNTSFTMRNLNDQATCTVFVNQYLGVERNQQQQDTSNKTRFVINWNPENVNESHFSQGADNIHVY